MIGVTEILDYSCPPYLVKWFKNNSAAKTEKIGKDSAEIGTLVNRLIEDDINNGKYVSPLGNVPALNCLAQWEILKKERSEFVPSVKEMQTEIRAFGCFGYIDFLNQQEDHCGLTELKCTSGIRAKHWIQLAQYARMLMDIRGWKFPDFIRTIRLPQDGSAYEWVEITEASMIRKLMRMFDGYYEVYQSEKIINEFFRTQNENLILGEI